MLIGKKYKIEADNLNITIYKKGTSRRTGEVYWRPVGYFARIDQALKHLVDLELKETELKELKTVVVRQADLYRLIKDLKPPQDLLQLVREREKRLR